ncbi:ABC transporter substrate-binding protein [Arenibaculum pallidiluteum]|uniref:ABC transporter substrate-binding protein n=1 Tax=Arenibaculum pallidiluteum TaxID=2812559 RepID=UPI001A97D231|nr:ABC transporter substrate-binding protein [Arenibaculum pallidiluteum]
MRVLRAVLPALALAVAAFPAAAQQPIVAITAIIDHPSLDAVREGVRAKLREAGYTEGRDLRVEYQSAQGNPATASQIARQFVGMNPAVIVPIATPSAQAVVAATRDVPVVFSAVTDPVGAQLVRDMAKPGGNVTGVSDFPPVADHLKLIAEILPGAKRIGVPYNPGDANSVSLLKHLKELAAPLGLTVVEATANRTAEVPAAGRSLLGKADAIYTMLDNTVISALESLILVANQNRMPIFSGDVESVNRGTIASIGFDYGDIGRQTGEIVVRVIKGEKPGAIPVALAAKRDLVVNPKAAATQGVTLPQAVLARASRVVGQ